MGLKERFNNIATGIECAIIGQKTWAMKTSSFSDRLWYFRTTGRWPQGADPLFEQISAQKDIEATTNSGCEKVKLGSARKIGLDVHPKK